jgi:hypothetical protein
MSKKTSIYMRRRMAQGKVQNGVVMFSPSRPLECLSHSRPFSNESIIGEQPSAKFAEEAITNAYLALQKIKDGILPTEDTECHDLVGHCIGVSQIRILDIGGEGANELIGELNDAAHALQRTRVRHERTGKWGLDGPAINEIRNALYIYETVVRSSSPLQMERAQGVRLDKIRKQQSQINEAKQ